MRTTALITVLLIYFCNLTVASAQTEVTPQYLPFTFYLKGVNLHLWLGIDSMGRDTYRHQDANKILYFFDTVPPNLNNKDTFVLGSSFLSPEGGSINYKKWDGHGVYPFSGIESVYVVKFIEDSLQNIFNFFTYTFETHDLYRNGNNYQHFFLSMKNVPFAKLANGNVVVNLSDSEFTTYTDSIYFYQYEDLFGGPLSTRTDWMYGWKTDSLFSFRMFFGNGHFSRVETQSNDTPGALLCNIVTDQIHFEAVSEIAPVNIELYDLIGHKVKSFLIDGGSTDIDLDIHDLTPGPYLLSCSGAIYKVYKIK